MSKNPTGVRTVTIIVTHDDPERDFSRTYTANQITEAGARYEDHRSSNPNELDTRDWSMTTFEDERIQPFWSMPRPERER